MQEFLFIGIDFSKSRFDVPVLENIEQKNYAQAGFENSERGYREFLKRLPGQSKKIKRVNRLICGEHSGEHTGLYSRGLADFPA